MSDSQLAADVLMALARAEPQARENFLNGHCLVLEGKLDSHVRLRIEDASKR